MENQEKSIQEIPDDRLKIFVTMFRLGGINILPGKVSVIHKLYFIIAAFFSYTNFFAIFVDTFYAEDLSHIMENIRVLTGIFFTIWIRNYIRFRKRAIVKVMNMTRRFYWENMPAVDGMGNTSRASLIPKFHNIPWKVCIYIVMFHFIYFITARYGQRLLSINSYYPYDWTKTPLYELTNVSQFLAAYVYVNIAFGFMGLYGTLTCIGCAQLDNLKINIMQIRQESETERDYGAESDEKQQIEKVQTSEETFRRMQKQLNDCIRQHQEILKYMNSLEEVLSPMFLGFFLIVTAGLCLSAFSFVTNLGDILQMAQALLVYCSFTVMLCCTNWFGNELTNQADSVRDAVFGCDWVGTPISFQRCIIFMIARSNKEFTLTAGKIVSVNNKTMASILNQTVSYLMFLVQVKEKNVEN